MNIHQITVAQVVKLKSRLKGAGLMNKKDKEIITTFIKAAEDNNPAGITRDIMIELHFLIQHSNQFLEGQSSAKYELNLDGGKKLKYKNGKRIFLD